MYSLDKLAFLQQIAEYEVGKQFHNYIMTLDEFPEDGDELYSKFMNEYFDINVIPVDLIINYVEKAFTVDDVSTAKLEQHHSEDGRVMLCLCINDPQSNFSFYVDELPNHQEFILYDVIKYMLIMPAIKKYFLY